VTTLDLSGTASRRIADRRDLDPTPIARTSTVSGLIKSLGNSKSENEPMAYRRAIHWAAGLFGLEIKRLRSERWLTRFPIRTVIDVGANTGQFALVARRLFPEALIHAFEPLPDCLWQMTQLFRSDTRFRAHGCALGERDGVITFHQSDFSPSSSVLDMDPAHRRLVPPSAHSKEITVPIRRLDDALAGELLEPEIFLKLDVQGYEDRVLDGAVEVLKQARIVQTEVLFEHLYRGQAEFTDIYDRLTSAGFTFLGNSEQITTKDGRILWADALFVRMA
jgi:FkbM family methyltransferase